VIDRVNPGVRVFALYIQAPIFRTRADHNGREGEACACLRYLFGLTQPVGREDGGGGGAGACSKEPKGGLTRVWTREMKGKGTNITLKANRNVLRLSSVLEVAGVGLGLG